MRLEFIYIAFVVYWQTQTLSVNEPLGLLKHYVCSY